jgi:hypothetical protein
MTVERPLRSEVERAARDGALLEPLHQATDLPRFPYPFPGRCWDASLIENHCYAVP